MTVFRGYSAFNLENWNQKGEDLSDSPGGEKEYCGSPAVRMMQAGRGLLSSHWDHLSGAHGVTGFCYGLCFASDPIQQSPSKDLPITV